MKHLAVLLALTLEMFAVRALAEDAGTPEGDGGPPAPISDPEPAVDPFVGAEADLMERPSSDGPLTLIAPDESLFQVAGIDVVARLDRTADDAPGSVYVLDQAQLERLNYDDVKQVLSHVPGVYVRQEDGYGLRPNIGLRGADADRSKKITLMEDGVLFGPAPYSAPAAYYFPIMTRIVGLEVFKGATAIRYGPQTIGGGLDLRTRAVPTDGTVAAIDASAGNTYFTKVHGHGGYGEERWGLVAEGVHVSSTGFKQLDGGGGTGFGRQELMLKGRLNTDPDKRVFQRLEPKLGYAHEKSNETYLGLSDADFRDNPLRRYRASRLDGLSYSRFQVELSHMLGVGEHFELNTVAYRHDFSRLWNRLDGLVDGSDTLADDSDTLADDSLPGLKEITDNPQGYARYHELLQGSSDSDEAGARLLLAGNRRRFVSQGVQAVARSDFVTGPVKHQLELGLRVHQDAIRRRHTATTYSVIGGKPQPDGAARPLLAHNEVQTLAVAVHSVYSVTFSGLTLSPGVRAEVIRSKYTEHLDAAAGATVRFDPNVVLFALGLRYAVTGELALIGGVQQGMTPVAPSLGPVRSNGRRVATPPKGQVERAVNYEGGVRYTGAELQASAIGFASDYNHVVSPCDDNCSSGETSSTSFYSGLALVYGAELGGHGRARLVGGYGLPWSASYTYTHAAFLQEFKTTNPVWAGPDGKVRAGDGMPYIPAHQFSLGAGIDYQETIGLDLVLNFTDRMRETAGQGALQKGDYTDRYALLDAAAYYQLLEGLRIYLKADNLTNNQPLVSRRPFGARPNQPLLVQVGVKLEF